MRFWNEAMSDSIFLSVDSCGALAFWTSSQIFWQTLILAAHSSTLPQLVSHSAANTTSNGIIREHKNKARAIKTRGMVHSVYHALFYKKDKHVTYHLFLIAFFIASITCLC